MQRLVIAVVIGVLLAPLLALTGCGGGGGGSGMGDPYEARVVLTNVITAGFEDDFAKARPHLDVVEWLTMIQDPARATYGTAAPAEQEELARRFFGMVKQVTEFSDLPDSASIHNAVKSATEEVSPQLKVVMFRFSAPDKEKPGRMINVVSKMRYTTSGTWQICNIQAEW